MAIRGMGQANRAMATKAPPPSPAELESKAEVKFAKADALNSQALSDYLKGGKLYRQGEAEGGINGMTDMRIGREMMADACKLFAKAAPQYESVAKDHEAAGEAYGKDSKRSAAKRAFQSAAFDYFNAATAWENAGNTKRADAATIAKAGATARANQFG